MYAINKQYEESILTFSGFGDKVFCSKSIASATYCRVTQKTYKIAALYLFFYIEQKARRILHDNSAKYRNC